MTGVSRCSGIGSIVESGSWEELRRQHEQVNRLLKLRAHLISTGIHECRGALVALRGYSKLLLEGEPGAINSAQEEYLHIIAENTQKLTLLLANLGRWVSYEDLALEPCDFLELWRQTVRKLDWAITGKALHLQANLPNTPQLILADAGKLCHALHLFLSDVIRLLPEGGELAVAVSPSEESIRVSIADPRGVITSQPPSQPAMEEAIRVHGGSFAAPRSLEEGLAITFMLPTYDGRSVISIGGGE